MAKGFDVLYDNVAKSDGIRRLKTRIHGKNLFPCMGIGGGLN